MVTDDVGILHHLPHGPPPLPGDEAEHGPNHLPTAPHIYSHTHHSLIHRVTPRRLPQRGLSPNFSINSYYLDLLNRIGFNSPLPAGSNTPFPSSPVRPPKPAERLEPTKEGSKNLVPVVAMRERTTHVWSFVAHVSQALQMESDWPMSSQIVEEGDTALETRLLPTPPAELSIGFMDLDHPVGGMSQGPDGSVPATRPDIAGPSLLGPEPGRSVPPQGFTSKVPPVSPSPDPDASSLMVVDHAPLKRQAMRGNFRAPEQVAPEEAQWRTGKAPGYQGLNQKRKAESSSDHENESRDIGVSAARVLKRPFKPPTIVKLPTARKVRLKPTQPAAPVNKPRIGLTRQLGTTLRAKPFIPPSQAADGSSAQPHLNSFRRTSRSGKSSAMDLNKPLIASLENRLLTIRKAINLDQSNNDSVVDGRVHTWRHAGREVADMLFALLPQPSEDCESRLTSSHWDDWGYGNDHHSERLTPVQLEYLRNAPTDANGDILDEAGDRVFGGNDDITSFIDQALSLDHCTPATERYRDECDPVPKTEYGVWDKGAMLLRLRVDPNLLGWDREAEDWMEMGE